MAISGYIGFSIHSLYFQKCRFRCLRRRDGGHPPPPAQTRTCSFSASGSSVALASAQTATRRLFAIARSEVRLQSPARRCPVQVSRAGCVLPPGPSPCNGLSPSPSTMPGKTPQQHAAGFPFDSTPPPACSGLPSDHLGCGLTPCPGFPCRASIAVYRMIGLPSGQEPMGPPGFSDASLPACHGLRTPADLHILAPDGCSCVAFGVR